MISTLSTQETLKMIEGPAGQLEMVIKENEEKSGIFAIVCHPHPLYGGTMHNKIVTTLCKVFQDMEANTIRFNFRGIGQSEGEYGEGRGELEDLFAVIDWVQAAYGRQEIWLGGFSFGAYIAALATTRVAAKKLVTIAPPVQHFSMNDLPPITCPWVLVQGELDDVVPPNDVLAWAESRVPKPIILRFPQAGHYFHGQLGELRARIKEAW
jgi:uncharacterized protein